MASVPTILPCMIAFVATLSAVVLNESVENSERQQVVTVSGEASCKGSR